MTLLDVRGLSVRYGRHQALNDVSITVEQGEIVTILGANGAGKSTLLKGLLGIEKAQKGHVFLSGVDVTGHAAHRRISEGLVLVPEGRRILITQTIEENLLLGSYARRDEGNIDDEIDHIYQRFPNLKDRRHAEASCLSGGEQQMLAIGRAILARPSLLMLDEPSLGLSPLFVQNLFKLMKELNDEGISILLVEQNTEQALALADRAYVLDQGRVSISGPADEVAASGHLAEVYLGAAE